MAMYGDHIQPAETGERRGVRRTGPFILGGLTAGHGVFHWINQSLVVMLPEVRDTFGLSGLQVGAISATRELTGGVIALPGGIVSDLLRHYWGAVLAGCMAAFGLGWMVIGLSPVFPLLLMGVGIESISSSLWHLPGVAALSHHFAHRRGSALSFHGVGGNIGDVLGPVLTGFLLGVLAWREVIAVYSAVPIFLSFIVFWAFRDIGRFGDGAVERPDVRAHMAQSRILLKNRRLWGITLVAGLRGMAFVALTTFLSLYLKDVAQLSEGWRGFYFAVPMLVGIVTTPAMGYLSDRLGRKLVLVPGMLMLAVLTLLLVPFGEGATLPLILGLLGIFLFSDQPILMAAALDIVGEGVAATTLGVLSFSRFALSTASPLIGGMLYDRDVYFPFYFVAGLFGLAAVILLAVPLGTGGQATDSQPGDQPGHAAAR